MTCSSSTISAPDRRPYRRRVALALLIAALAGPGLAAPAWRDAVAKAREDLAQGDAIAAEVGLRRALDSGAPREAVAAYLGEAYLAQDLPEKARIWLEPGEFAPDSAAWGFRLLARLEREAKDLPAAGLAFDRAMALTPRDATMWVEIGRLRYVGGEHMLALDAADYALKLDPENVRALEFKGQFVRDQQGLAAGLPWFERALRLSPRDIGVLGEYASTLGDMGRAVKMLDVTRQMLQVEPGNPRAFYLQAVLAARAGKTELARGLLARAGKAVEAMPAALLLEGLLEMRAGNNGLAAEALSQLVRLQPANDRARLLLARAYARRGDDRLLIHDYAEEAARPEATPYLLTLVARAYEADGRRDLAAPLLDRAALARRPDFYSIATGSEYGSLLAAGRIDEARAGIERNLESNPGSAFNQAIAGDLMLAGGDAAGAMQHYRLAARVRLTDDLLLRMVRAAVQSGQGAEAASLIEAYRAANPADYLAQRLAADAAAKAHDWPRARRLLEALRMNGGASDVALLADLALAQLRSGDARLAEQTARQAYALQRGSPVAAEAWAFSLQALGAAAPAQALLAKSQAQLAQR